MFSLLPKDIQTIIYRHLFNFVLDELSLRTTNVKKHFLMKKWRAKNANVHDCNEIEIIGFNNDHELYYCKCSYYKLNSGWDLNEMGNIIESVFFDDEYFSEEENYDSY